MEFIGLNAAFQPLCTLRCVNIQWNRRYYEAGEYQLQLRTKDWDPAVAYIFTRERPETGMVEKVETEHTLKGDFTLVSGYFLEGMLNWKVVYPRWQALGNLPAACRALVTAQMADTGLLVPGADTLGADAVCDVLGEPLGDTTYSVLKLQAFSQRITLDYPAETLSYAVWQGLDRTQGQNINPYAVFSQDFGTVDTMTLTQDGSAYRNYAVAAYDGGELLVDIRTDPAEPKRMLYLDTGLDQTDGQTEAEFLAAVRTAALTELCKYVRIVNIDADVLQNNLHYLADYDLGDLCDVRDNRLKLAFESRIIEIDEVWKENRHMVSLQFGDKLPTIYRQGRA
ncbi:MAG: hypothetical protein PHY64_01445 [Eubacteriales bacterium]|nr:hypothetical protein [Eubacteriales bacterium]